jgi:hypothetical protein
VRQTKGAMTPRRRPSGAAGWQEELCSALIDGPYGRLLLLLQYGSPAGEDRDYLLVYHEQPPTGMAFLGGADIIALGKDQFMRGAELWDPLVTEPLLTGRTIIEDADTAARCRVLLSDRPDKARRARLCIERADEALERAAQAAHSRFGDALRARFFYSSLSFGITYAVCGNGVDQGCPSARKLKELLTLAPAPDRELYRRVLQAKRAMAPPSMDTWEECRHRILALRDGSRPLDGC